MDLACGVGSGSEEEDTLQEKAVVEEEGSGELPVPLLAPADHPLPGRVTPAPRPPRPAPTRSNRVDRGEAGPRVPPICYTLPAPPVREDQHIPYRGGVLK